MLSRFLQKSETPRTSRKRGKLDSFKWKPLTSQRNEFRLVELHEVNDENGVSIISASIHNVPGNGHTPYTALSYSWGDGKSTMKILLDQMIHLITENLHNALLTLIVHGVTHIWIDALCIDQDDPDEKAAQVQRMATIFQNAASVMVWLAALSPSIERVINLLKSLDLTALERKFWGQDLLEKNSFGELLKFNQDFDDFLTCTYWKRTWIAQEIAVARQIVLFCGIEYIDGAIFESLFSLTYWKSFRTNAYKQWNVHSFEAFEHLVSLWNLRNSFRTREPIHLMGLLMDLRYSKTSLELDRIYAIYGLAFDQRAFITEPNYTFSSLQLCLEMNRRFVETTGSLDIVLLRRFWSHSSLPSWCCPFLKFDRLYGQDRYAQRMINYVDGKLSKLRCGEFTKFWSTTDSDPASNEQTLWEGQTMKVTGLRLGKMTSFNPLLGASAASRVSDDGVCSELLAIFDSASRLMMIHSHLYEEHRRLADLVLPILQNAYRLHCKERADLNDGIFQLSLYLRRTLTLQAPSSVVFEDMLRLSRDRADSQPISNLTAEETEHTMTMILEFTDVYSPGSMRYFLIDYENVGFMPDIRLKTETEVWLLSHCSMPVILKKADPEECEGQVCYNIISEAYIDRAKIHGKNYNVMNGEAWKAAKREDFERISIV